MSHTSTLAGALLVILGNAAFAYTDLSDPSEPWKATKVGVTNTVPAPFQPLTVDGQKVSCWGRSYTLGAPFPTSIASQEQELLAGPIRIKVKAGGQETILQAQPVEIKSSAADRVEFAAELKAGAVTIRMPGWIEYDGAIGVDMEVDGGGAQIEYLGIEIPLRPEIARYFYYHGQWQGLQYGNVGKSPGWEVASSWQPNWWVGDDYRGLSLFTETVGGWTGPADRALVISRTAEAILLTANIIGEPTTLEAPRSYRIALQATPGKPLPPDWHGRVVGPCSSTPTPEFARELIEERHTNVVVLWSDSAKFFSYPEPKDPTAFKQAVQTYHDAGIRCVYYLTLSGTGQGSGVMQRNYRQWLMTGPDQKAVFGQNAKDPDLATADAGDWSSVCPAGSYTDWLVWAVDRIMEEYDLDGVYIDNPGPYYCSNPEHGCGTRGARTHPYSANRELHKRLWNVVHGRKPDTGIVWEHNSRSSNSLQLTFCDIYSDGEHFRIKSKGFPEQLERPQMDITFTGRQWGSQPGFLCSALNLREEYTPWLLARVLPYGNHLFASTSWMDFSAYSPALKARHDFGLGTQQVEWFTPEATPEWFAYSPKGPGAVIRTRNGDIRLELFRDDAPVTVESFTMLANRGFYNGLTFHRVIKDFMIQGGCPRGDGRGGPGYTFRDEINEYKVVPGALAMANSGPDTNGSQFFIVTEQDQPHLDGKHTVFGRVTWGMHNVKAIAALPGDADGKPTEPVVMQKVDTSELLVGGYIVPQQRALITISNIGHDKEVCRAPMAQIEAYFGGPVKVYDAISGVRCYPLGQTLVVAVPGDNFRMIRIEREGQ